MSSFHTSGVAAIQSPSMLMQRSSARSITLTPFSRSHSIPPSKFTDSPTTTVPMLNCRTRPLQYQHGASVVRSEEHTSELQSLMRISYAVFCLKQKNLTYSAELDRA